MCDILQYSDSKKAIARHVEEHQKITQIYTKLKGIFVPLLKGMKKYFI